MTPERVLEAVDRRDESHVGSAIDDVATSVRDTQGVPG
jgi:hypothetical protein